MSGIEVVRWILKEELLGSNRQWVTSSNETPYAVAVSLHMIGRDAIRNGARDHWHSRLVSPPATYSAGTTSQFHGCMCSPSEHGAYNAIDLTTGRAMEKSCSTTRVLR